MYDEVIYETDNELGIPLLKISMQAERVIKPCYAWGSQSRNRINEGMWHFYVDDYRWSNLLKNPWKCTETRPQVCTELNISLFEDTPPALVVAEIYKKRWVSRYFQDQGIKMFVDLFVPENHMELNLLGVPAGWRAYSTRGKSKEVDSLDKELEVARKHAQTEDVLFAVFGGGNVVGDWCQMNKAVHLPYKFKENPYSSGKSL